MLCYKVLDVLRSYTSRELSVKNLFGIEDLTTKKPRTLCVPTREIP